MKHILYAIIVIILFIQGCSAENETKEELWPTEKWRFSSPEEQGMDSEIIGSLVETISKERGTKNAINSFLIIRNGSIITEDYHGFYNENVKQNIYSVTKSLATTVFGLAEDKKFVNDSDDIWKVFNDSNVSNMDDRKSAITFKDLLTMQSGFEWVEYSTYYRLKNNDYVDLLLNKKPTEYTLKKPMSITPGIAFNYNGGNSHLLMSAVTKKIDNNITSFINKSLFDPLGITNVYWPLLADNVPAGGSSLRMTPRDMAKIGYLFLKNGRWKEQEIISENWIQKATDVHVRGETVRYGYQWHIDYIDDRKFFYGQGLFGQYIIVMPEEELVVVFTSNAHDQSHSARPKGYFMSYIYQAIKSDEALPENIKAYQALQKHLTNNNEKPTVSNKILPKNDRPWINQQISFKDNDRNWTSAEMALDIEQRVGELILETNDQSISVDISLDGTYTRNIVPMQSEAGLDALGEVMTAGSFEDDYTFIIHATLLETLDQFEITMTYNTLFSEVSVDVNNLSFPSLNTPTLSGILAGKDDIR